MSIVITSTESTICLSVKGNFGDYNHMYIPIDEVDDFIERLKAEKSKSLRSALSSAERELEKWQNYVTKLRLRLELGEQRGNVD